MTITAKNKIVQGMGRSSGGCKKKCEKRKGGIKIVPWEGSPTSYINIPVSVYKGKFKRNVFNKNVHTMNYATSGGCRCVRVGDV